ncbi:MAG: S41 family peptidase [Pseudomonadota bacterium]
MSWVSRVGRTAAIACLLASGLASGDSTVQRAPREASAPALTTVILVRHAQKRRLPADDPPLTAAGRARAEAIASLLARAEVTASVDAVYASPFQRTRQTAEPLAARAGVPISAYDPRDSEALAERVLEDHAGGTVLVVGHSNTLPSLVDAFGGERAVPPIEDEEYDNLYIVTVPASEGQSSVLRLTLPPADEHTSIPSLSALAATQAWHLVKAEFLDGHAVSGEPWETAYAEYLAPLPSHADRTEASAAINAMLAGLATSHTSHYTPRDTAWFQLLGIFGDQFPALRARHFAQDGGEVSYEGLPIAVRRLNGRVFVSGLYRPAQLAGDELLLVGDELLTVDGDPFDEIEPFRGKAGQVVTLSVRRSPQGRAIPVLVRVERLRPARMFLDAVRAGAQVLEPTPGVPIAHVRMWSYAGVEYHDALRSLLRQPPFAEAQALVLDLRGGWGGADPSYADYFLARTATLSMRARSGVTTAYNDHWVKPLVLLVDGGTRSGKEVLAHTMQAHGVPVVGERTAGAVTAGRPFLLLDDSLLYLAVAAVTVDGQSLEGQGVVPDIVVDRGLAYAAGADPQLARAIALAQASIQVGEAPQR